MENCAALFVKYPQAGRVKTRLAAVLGGRQSALLYRAFVEDTVSMLTQGAHAACIYYSPRGKRAAFQTWLGSTAIYRQQQGIDLGARMRNAFSDSFSRGYAKAVVIGTDMPDLPGSLLQKAFRALDAADAVIGPSRDGGYYLIGLTAGGFRRELFDEIPWSTDRVFSSTAAVLSRFRLRCTVLDRRRDIDTWDDLKAFYRRNRIRNDLRSVAHLRARRSVRERLEQ